MAVSPEDLNWGKYIIDKLEKARDRDYSVHKPSAEELVTEEARFLRMLREASGNTKPTFKIVE